MPLLKKKKKEQYLCDRIEMNLLASVWPGLKSLTGDKISPASQVSVNGAGVKKNDRQDDSDRTRVTSTEALEEHESKLKKNSDNHQVLRNFPPSVQFEIPH